MEKSYGAQDSAQYPDTFHVTRGSTPSNRLLKVLPAPRCVLTSVTPTVQDAKGYVTMNGNYLTADCDITFYTPTGQAFPATKKNMIYSGLNVQVPDMPGSKGSVSARPAGAAQSGAMIPFEVRGLTPLLATRADMSAIGGFGQKIMGIEWKTYKAYASPVTPDQPFKCDAKCEVYQNGNVYTYVYMFTLNEFVVTTRTLNYMTLVWPDLNDSSLKYGVGLEKTKMTATEAQYWIKGETRHNLEMGFFSQRGKDLCVYIQSKRPPKQGECTNSG